MARLSRPQEAAKRYTVDKLNVEQVADKMRIGVPTVRTYLSKEGVSLRAEDNAVAGNPTDHEPLDLSNDTELSPDDQDRAEVPWSTDPDDIEALLSRFDVTSDEPARNHGWVAGVLDDALAGEMDFSFSEASTEELIQAVYYCRNNNLIDLSTAQQCFHVIDPTAYPLPGETSEDQATIEAMRCVDHALDAAAAGDNQPLDDLINSGVLTEHRPGMPLTGDAENTAPARQATVDVLTEVLSDHLPHWDYGRATPEGLVSVIRWAHNNHRIDSDSALRCLQGINPTLSLNSRRSDGKCPTELDGAYTVTDGDHIETVIADSAEQAVETVLDSIAPNLFDMGPLEDDVDSNWSETLGPESGWFGNNEWWERAEVYSRLSPTGGPSSMIWVHDHRLSRV